MISAEAIQLEARERQLALLTQRAAKALSALEDGLAKLNHLSPMTMTLQDLIDAKLCIGEAKEWLRGENDRQLTNENIRKEEQRTQALGHLRDALDILLQAVLPDCTYPPGRISAARQTIVEAVRLLEGRA